VPPPAAPSALGLLGHGVLPEADPAVLARLADLVHAETSGTAF